MRICRVCKVEKQLSENNFKPIKDRYYSNECRDCYNKRCATYSTKWKNTSAYERRLKRYNIELLKLQDMESKFDGKCWICKVEEWKCIDHDHSCCIKKSQSCGKCVRGLLCINCNNAIGRLKDNVTILKNAIEYLKDHSATSLGWE